MKADLPAVLKAYATERGHVVAVESGGVALDYASLDRCVERFATALRSTGIASGDRVAFLANTCVEYFVFLIGSMRVGAVAVPVNWRLASPEIASVLNDAEAVLLVVGETFLAQIEELLERLEHVRHIVSLGRHQRLPGWEEWLNDHANDSHAPVESNDESIVFQMYTSGTTGMPKGVMTSNAGLLSYLERLSSTARITPRSVTLSTLPLFHIGGTGWALAGLYRGGTVHLLRDVNADRII
ncbi:MAG: AMP-binding protein, partial [Thermomicrobiales bacterium]